MITTQIVEKVVLPQENDDFSKNLIIGFDVLDEPKNPNENIKFPLGLLAF